MSAPDRASAPRADLVEVFYDRCARAADDYATGRIALLDAVDDLQAWAETRNVVEEIGQDMVQQIMATAFAPVRDDLAGQVPGDEYEGLSPTFASACKRADQEHAQARKLRLAAQHGGAAASTVEALMYSLRERRTKALGEPDTQRRIRELSEAQVREVGARLHALKITTPWSVAEIEQLLKTWIACHA
jgi:hypothetical protein